MGMTNQPGHLRPQRPRIVLKSRSNRQSRLRLAINACLLCWAFLFIAPAFSQTSKESTPEDDKAPVEAEEPRPAERVGIVAPDSERLLEQDLSVSAPLTISQWLNIGEDQFLALIEPSHLTQAKGTVFLLPDRGQTPDWPNTLKPLRHQLAERGWTTIALQLPQAPPPPPPPRPLSAEENTEAPGSTEDQENKGDEQSDSPNAESPEAAPEPRIASEPEPDLEPNSEPEPSPVMTVAEQFEQLAQAAEAQASTYGGAPFIFVGVGEGAYWAALWAQGKQNLGQAPTTLVLIDAENRVIGEDRVITDFWQAGVATLDLVRQVTTDSQTRKAKALRLSGLAYKQQRLPTRDMGLGLTNRVAGFVSRQ